MISNNIGIGDRLEIRHKNNELIDKVYISQVQNIIDEYKVIIYVPITYGKLAELSKGTTFNFLFFTEKGIISFDGKIDEYNKKEGFNLMTIVLTSQGEKVQRRGFFRFVCVLPFNFYILDDESNTSIENDKICSGVVKDISAGGLRFITNEEINETKIIKSLLDLDKEVLISIGNIIQKHNFPKSNYKYQYRVKFIDISPTEQEKIVQFIFSEQRRLLQTIDTKQN